MQLTMTLDNCARCGRPIRPGEPVMQSASVDIVHNQAASSPVRSEHLRGMCPGEEPDADARAPYSSFPPLHQA